MMIMAEEHDDGDRRPSFYTSTQMGGRRPPLRPESPLLSPLGPPTLAGTGNRPADKNQTQSPTMNNRTGTDSPTNSKSNAQEMNLRNSVGITRLARNRALKVRRVKSTES